MKQFKRLLCLMLALVLTMAVVPSAGAWELFINGTYAEVDNFSEILKAIQDPNIEYIEMTGDVTISKSFTLPEDVSFYSDYKVTIPSGVTVTVSKYCSVNLGGTLVLNGAISTADACYVTLMQSVSGSGSVKGSGELYYYDWNTFNSDGKTTSVTYSTLGSIKVDSSVETSHVLDITMDKFSGIKTSPAIYDVVNLTPCPAMSNLTISKAVEIQNLQFNNYYDASTRKYTYPKLTVKKGGTLTITNSMITSTATVTVENGGKIIANSLSVTGAYSAGRPAGSLTIKDGGRVEADVLSMGNSGDDMARSVAYVYGTLVVNDYLSNNGDIRVCGTFDRCDSYYCKSGKIFSPFLDTEEGAWYSTQVEWAIEKGITSGMGDGTFAPGATCNRAQVVTFLWRAAGSPKPKSTKNPFVDVPSGQFYTDAVLWAVEEGITSGADKTHFNPNGACSRAQVVTFLWRAAGSPDPKSSKNPFSDVQKGQFYTDAVLWAVEQEITNGITDTTFVPNSSCNRAQIVTFLYRYKT